MRHAGAGPPASEQAGAAEPSKELTRAAQWGIESVRAGQTVTRARQWHPVNSCFPFSPSPLLTSNFRKAGPRVTKRKKDLQTSPHHWLR